MNTSPKSVKLLFLAVLLLTASTSYFGAPSTAQNDPAAPDTTLPASNSPLPSSPSPSSPAPTPQTKEFDQKWKALTDAIRANLNQESAENFKKVQDAAQELNKVPNLAYDLQAYLSDSIINYPSLPPEEDYKSFNTVLAKEWLPEKCKQNVIICFDSTNKKATVNGIIEALNQKYKPQSLPSPSPTPSPASSPTPTASTSPSPGDASSSGENSRQRSMGGFLGLILLLGCGGLAVWALSKTNPVRKWLGQDISEDQLAAENEDHNKARPRNEDRSPIANASGKTALKSRVQNPRDFEENEKLREEVRTLTHDCNELKQQVKSLQEDLQNIKSQPTQSYPETQLSQRWIGIQGTNPGNQDVPFSPASSLGGYPDSTESRYGQNAGILPSGSSQSPMVPSSNPAPGTNSHQEQLKRLFSQGIPVEDANMGQRRAGYEDYPVFARSSQGRSRLAVYPNPNTNELCLLPNPNTATYQYLESYFNLEPGSSPNGLLYLIQAAQVIPHGDGWRLAVKGIIRFT
jgi:hypothetical protein